MLARFAAGSAAALFLLFFALTVVGLSEDPFEIVFGIPPLVEAGLTAALVGTVLSLLCVPLLVPAWRSRYWSLGGRLHYSIVVGALLCIVWFLYFWNLLGYQY